MSTANAEIYFFLCFCDAESGATSTAVGNIPATLCGCYCVFCFAMISVSLTVRLTIFPPRLYSICSAFGEGARARSISRHQSCRGAKEAKRCSRSAGWGAWPRRGKSSKQARDAGGVWASLPRSCRRVARSAKRTLNRSLRSSSHEALHGWDFSNSRRSPCWVDRAEGDARGS